MKKLALTLALIVGSLGSGILTGNLIAATAAPAPSITKTIIHEDSPRFDCRKHGNRTCGVRLDPTPNDGKRQSVRINIVFNKKGQPIDAYPFGARR